MSDLVSKLQAALDDAVASGEECGCQLAVYQHGQLLCDLSAGYTTPEKTTKVTTETLFPIFSVGKGVVTTLLHHLAEQEKLRYEDKVADYWPEYACNGKEETRVWQLLSHRAGLYEVPKQLDFLEWFDWNKVIPALAQSAPLDTIGGMHHYHAHTYGALVGHLAELADGRPLRQLLQEELLGPMGIDGLFFGISQEQYDAGVAFIDGTVAPNDSRVLFNQFGCLGGLNPSSNGCANAHSLAKLYMNLLPEKQYLKQETLKNATTLCRCPEDTNLNAWDKFGLGYALCGPQDDLSRMFGHGGAVGSEGFCDQETGYAVGFTKNKLNRTHPIHPTRNAISDILGIPHRIW